MINKSVVSWKTVKVLRFSRSLKWIHMSLSGDIWNNKKTMSGHKIKQNKIAGRGLALGVGMTPRVCDHVIIVHKCHLRSSVCFCGQISHGITQFEIWLSLSIDDHTGLKRRSTALCYLNVCCCCCCFTLMFRWLSVHTVHLVGLYWILHFHFILLSLL